MGVQCTYSRANASEFDRRSRMIDGLVFPRPRFNATSMRLDVRIENVTATRGGWARQGAVTSTTWR